MLRTAPCTLRAIAARIRGVSALLTIIRRRPALPAATLLVLLTHNAAAQTSCTAPSTDCVAVGEWNVSVSLGAGARSNPVHGSSDIPLVVIPHISYYGKRFFLHDLEFGVTLHETDANTFSLIAAPGYDRVFFVRNDLQNLFVGSATNRLVASDKAPPPIGVLPIRHRSTTYLVGPEWTFEHGRLTGQFDALREVTGVHDGYEVRAAVAVAIMPGEASPAGPSGSSSSGGKPRGVLAASTGFTWKSAEVVRYYYGVEGLYAPGSALNPFIKMGYSRPLADRWTFTVFAHYEYLGSAIADSPIVTDHGVTTVFAGVVFTLL